MPGRHDGGSARVSSAHHKVDSNWTLKISENVGNVDNLTLSWLAQLGCEWVVLQGTDWVDSNGDGCWKKDEIEPIQE